MQNRKQSELSVITKAKDLCSYILTVTEKSPKRFRFTLTTKLQNLLGAWMKSDDRRMGIRS